MGPGLDRTPTVLVVEDEPALARLYAQWLDDRYDVETCLTGEAAVERMRPDVDVLLLDRRLPEMSGDAVLQEVRDRRLPCSVVMVTAVDPDRSTLELDFDDYLVKPVDSDAVRDAVERMLERRRHDDRLQELFQVVSKLATLEAKMDLDELQDSDTYDELQRRFETLWDDLEDGDLHEDVYRDVTLEKLGGLLNRMELRQ